MKRSLAILCLIALGRIALNAYAATETPVSSRAGGQVLRPGSQRGSIVIVNSQKKVVSAHLKTVAENLRVKIGLNVRIEDGEGVGVETALKAKKALGAEVAVFMVEDERLPVSLVAREERWGIVNLTRLEVGGVDDVQRFGRLRAEVMRTIALVCGAGDSQFPGSLMSAGDAPSDLDLVSCELPIDVMNKMVASLAKIGVTPASFVTYKRACREGWAPAPTNDAQRAIWEKVHAIPDKPIKIEFDPKKDK